MPPKRTAGITIAVEGFVMMSGLESGAERLRIVVVETAGGSGMLLY